MEVMPGVGRKVSMVSLGEGKLSTDSCPGKHMGSAKAASSTGGLTTSRAAVSLPPGTLLWITHG